MTDFDMIKTKPIKGKDYEEIALRHAEEYGIYSYKVKGNMMVWYSYFGETERFYKVMLNLDTFEEVRKPQNTCKHEYNYFCG